MIITNTIDLTIGDGKTATDAFMVMTPYVNTIETNGQVPCDLKVYYSEKDANAGAQNIIPIVKGVMVTNATIQFAPNEVIKLSGDCTMENVFIYFKTKLAAVLLEKYGWVVTVP